jgi:hypothetical protein
MMRKHRVAIVAMDAMEVNTLSNLILIMWSLFHMLGLS